MAYRSIDRRHFRQTDKSKSTLYRYEPPRGMTDVDWLYDNLQSQFLQCWTKKNFDLVLPITPRGTKLQDQENLGSGSKKTYASADVKDFEAVFAKKLDLENNEKWRPSPQPVASYNWFVDSWTPTIVVPGLPKQFVQWEGGQLVTREEEMVINEDAYRNPKAPMESLLCAVRVANPMYPLEKAHIIADLSCIKRIAHFLLECSGQTDHGYVFTRSLQNRGFRIDLETMDLGAEHLKEGPLVMLRREPLRVATWIGYGSAFMNACTKEPKDKNFKGPFKQVTEVDLGDVRLLIRHRVTAAIYENGETTDKEQATESVENLKSNVRIFCSKSGVAKYKSVELGSLASQRNVTVGKWLDMVFTGCDNMYLGRQVSGNFQELRMLSRDQVKRMSGVRHEKRLFQSLEMLLVQLLAWVRSRSNKHLALIGSSNDGINQEPTLKLYELRKKAVTQPIL